MMYSQITNCVLGTVAQAKVFWSIVTLSGVKAKLSFSLALVSKSEFTEGICKAIRLIVPNQRLLNLDLFRAHNLKPWLCLFQLVALLRITVPLYYI